MANGTALTRVKAEPTDPIRGIVNDILDSFGVARPEDMIGTPADVMHQVGLPTAKDAIPTPFDVGGKVFESMRTGRAPGAPPMPALPWPGVPAPGEGILAAKEGAAGVSGNVAPEGMSQRRYYQGVPPLPPPPFKLPLPGA